jgi:hypothetical protein
MKIAGEDSQIEPLAAQGDRNASSEAGIAVQVQV